MSEYISGLTKLAVFTGYEVDQRVFVIDLEDPNNVCKNLADVPVKVRSASGILFDDSVPMFCGGYYSGSKCDCFGYKQSEWVSYPAISTCRYLSASAALTDQENGKTRFVMSGGFNSNGFLSNVEAFNGETWSSLPNLPSPVYGHCMVAINDTVLLSMGGYTSQGYISKTYFFNSEMNEWSPGPDLNIPRGYLSCATVNWKNPSDGQLEKVVVVAGGDNGQYMSSVELLYINNLSRGWQYGPQLPYSVANSVLVEYKDTVVLVGGDGTGVDGKHLYQLSSPDGPWNEMEQTLPIKKHYHIAFLIPDDLTDCQKA